VASSIHLEEGELEKLPIKIGGKEEKAEQEAKKRGGGGGGGIGTGAFELKGGARSEPQRLDLAIAWLCRQLQDPCSVRNQIMKTVKGKSGKVNCRNLELDDSQVKYQQRKRPSGSLI